MQSLAESGTGQPVPTPSPASGGGTHAVTTGAAGGWIIVVAGIAAVAVVMFKMSRGGIRGGAGQYRQLARALRPRQPGAGVASKVGTWLVLRPAAWVVAFLFLGWPISGRPQSNARWMTTGTTTYDGRKALDPIPPRRTRKTAQDALQDDAPKRQDTPATEDVPGAPARDMAVLGSIALPTRQPEPVPLDPPEPVQDVASDPDREPHPWAVKTGKTIVEYDGHGARVLDGLGAGARAVGRALQALGGLLQPLARLFRVWHRWPTLLRGACRSGGLAFALCLVVPAWHIGALVLLAVAVPLLLGMAAWWEPRQPTDADRFGPKIWVILREDLGLEETEQRHDWMTIPADVRADGAKVVVRLPWDYRGDEGDRARLVELVNSRLPGDWIGRWEFLGDVHTVTLSHRPPPKPKPAPPDAVDIRDPRILERLKTLAPDEFIFGIGADDEIVVEKISGEAAHIALSVGSGGGKSTFLQWIAFQVYLKGGIPLGIDPKMISLKPMEGVKGTYIYADPDNGRDMRNALYWLAKVGHARYHEIKHGTVPEEGFTPLYMFMEETNQFASEMKQLWSRMRVTRGDDKDPQADPIWDEAVAKGLRLGRAADIHYVAVFQDLKDNEFSGTSLKPLFRKKVMGNYDENQWKRIVGTRTAMPANVAKAGRMVMTDEGIAKPFQTPYVFMDTEDGGKRPATEAEAVEVMHQLYVQARAEHGYTTRGLYTDPPANSPEAVPELIAERERAREMHAALAELAHRRDTDAEGPQEPSEGVSGRIPAARSVTPPESVASDVTEPGGLRVIEGGAGYLDADGKLDPAELLTMAEISRRLEAHGVDISAGRMRTDKKRRETTGFPEGTMVDGKEKFTVAQIAEFYQERERNKEKKAEGKNA